MLKNRLFRRIALFVSLIVLLTSTVNTTLGFITMQTDSLVGTFVPGKMEPDDFAVTIDIENIVNNTGASTIGPEGFEVVLESLQSGEKISVKSDENGKATITLPFSASDASKTYDYKLYVTDDGKKGVTYDTKVYDISVTVTISDDNKLVPYITVDGEATDTITARFEHSYQSEEVTPPLTGDFSNITFWLIVMLVSGTASVVLIILDKKYRIMEENSSSINHSK